jgi:hypothetical protein
MDIVALLDGSNLVIRSSGSTLKLLAATKPVHPKAKVEVVALRHPARGLRAERARLRGRERRLRSFRA